MNKESKYQPLFKYLHFINNDELKLTFSEIERILGLTLPESAYRTHAWWSNRSKGALQASSWMSAGYYVVALDLSEQYVTFRKSTIEQKAKRVNDIILWDGTLIKALRRYMQLSQEQLAKVLGVRQQTISEWECDLYHPRRAMLKYLTMVAEKANFKYKEVD